MKYLISILTLLIFTANAVVAQQTQKPENMGEKFYGKAFMVPEVRVHLTDEETGSPFAEKDAAAKYCWGWEVIKRTPATDRMPSTECTSVKIRTDVSGVAILPSLLMTPWRPVAPPGSELSEPRFLYAGITVHDEKHNTYMSVFDAERNLLNEKGEVHRTVRLYPRPKTPKE